MSDNQTKTASIQDISRRLNADGYVWVMQNYSDGTYWAVVGLAAGTDWLGDDLGYNFDGESYDTPEEALSKASERVLR